MFNCFNSPFGCPLVIEVTKHPFTSIAEVLEFNGDVAIPVPASKVVLIEPRLRARSVTPEERIKNGTAKSINSSNFLKPSLEDVERVSAVLAAIDDRFSYEAAVEKYRSSRSSEPASEPAFKTTPQQTSETASVAV